MSAQPAYDSLVEHLPRFLTHGLPADGELTGDLLRALPEDPFQSYVLVAKADAGQLFEVTEPVAVSFDPLALLDE
jgi:hypothetical protein